MNSIYSIAQSIFKIAIECEYFFDKMKAAKFLVEKSRKRIAKRMRKTRNDEKDKNAKSADSGSLCGRAFLNK